VTINSRSRALFLSLSSIRFVHQHHFGPLLYLCLCAAACALLCSCSCSLASPGAHLALTKHAHAFSRLLSCLCLCAAACALLLAFFSALLCSLSRSLASPSSHRARSRAFASSLVPLLVRCCLRSSLPFSALAPAHLLWSKGCSVADRLRSSRNP
jgi:hypothetical protein